MGTIRRYFAKHKWQRRVLTVSLSLTAGLVAAVLLYPHAADYWLIHQLGTDRPGLRDLLIRRAAAMAQESPRTLRRLEEALDTGSDRRFEAVATALNRIDRFYTPGRKPLHVSRLQTLQIEQTRSESSPLEAARTRRLILGEVIRGLQDDTYVRRALRAAASDEAPEVRALSAGLAGRLACDDVLGALLADGNDGVRASAALAAAAARRTALIETIRKVCRESGDAEAVSSAAYALALLAGATDGPALADRLRETRDPELRDRLLYVMTLLDIPQARQAVLYVLDEARRAGTPPPALALLAAGKMNLSEAAGDVRAVLAGATKEDSPLIEAQLLAALNAAEALKLPVRREVNHLCQNLWSPQLELTMMAAARLLGLQADLPQPDRPDVPSREACISTLRQAAVYAVEPQTQPDEAPRRVFTTPMASAAAAVALWMMRTDLDEMYVRNVAAAESTLPGDCVAWRLARSGDARAFPLGLAMLPPLGAPAEQRVYNENERSAGAMMLALAARTDEQKAQARDRIEGRLRGGQRGGEENPYVRGAYQCALLILGREDLRPEVRRLMDLGEFPQRRILTAQCLSGDRDLLDAIFFNPWAGDEDLAFLLVNKGIGEVVEAVLPELPKVDVAPRQDMRLWQIRILRTWYTVRRADLRPGRPE